MSRTAAALRLLVSAVLLGGGTARCGGGGGSAAPSPFPLGIVQGPAVALPAPTAATIAWTSSRSVVGSVDFGATATYGSVVTEPSPRRTHELRLTGLAPGTTTHYRILDDGIQRGGAHAFRTPASAGSAAPFRFAVVGDSGTGDDMERAVVARIDASDPDFVLLAGDVAYVAGTGEEVFRGFTVPFLGIAAKAPIFLTWGNHDVLTDGGAPLADAVVLPVNDEEASERYYAFTWGNLRAVCLDSTRAFGAGSPQRRWLDRELASTDLAAATWRIVVFHHPAWSSSSHGSDPEVDAELVPLFDAHGIDVVFNGHDHGYERTYPLLGGIPTTTGGPAFVDPTGTIYVVSGGGGRDLYPAGTSSFTAFSASAHHAMVVDVSGGTFSASATAPDGAVIDAFSITKSP